MLNTKEFNHISHLTLHNIGFGTRKIFSSEKFAENGEKMKGRQNLDLRDSMSALINQGNPLIVQVMVQLYIKFGDYRSPLSKGGDTTCPALDAGEGV